MQEDENDDISMDSVLEELRDFCGISAMSWEDSVRHILHEELGVPRAYYISPKYFNAFSVQAPDAAALNIHRLIMWFGRVEAVNKILI
jgi:hypothetical protein